METSQQVFFNVPLSELEPIFKRWMKEVQMEQPIIEPEEKILTIQEAADFLSLTVPTIYGKVSKGTIPYMKVEQSNRLYFSTSDLMEYIKQSRVKTKSEIEQDADTDLVNKKRG